MMNFVFLDVHLTLRKTRNKTQRVSTILSRIVLKYSIEYFVKKCVQKQFFPYVRCLTIKIRSHILVLKLFATRMQFL